MSEEEQRRACIIMGICPPAGLDAGPYGERAALLVKDLSEGLDHEPGLEEFAGLLLERYGLVWKERA